MAVEGRTDRVVFAFLTGEVSPRFDGRSDVEKLSTACRTVQNMTLGAFGFAERRPGLEFIAYTKEGSPAGSP